MFSNTKRVRIQEIISHYFTAFRRRNQITQKELAKESGLSTDQIKSFESLRKCSCIVNDLEKLHIISKIDKTDLLTLIAKILEIEPTNTGIILEPWQKIVIEKLSMLDFNTRRNLVHGNLSKYKSEEEVKNLFSCMVELMKVPRANQKIAIKALRSPTNVLNHFVGILENIKK